MVIHSVTYVNVGGSRFQMVIHSVAYVNVIMFQYLNLLYCGQLLRWNYRHIYVQANTLLQEELQCYSQLKYCNLVLINRQSKKNKNKRVNFDVESLLSDSLFDFNRDRSRFVWWSLWSCKRSSKNKGPAHRITMLFSIKVL
jgi:hypothetical protein